MRLLKSRFMSVATSAWRKLATRRSVARQSAMALKLSTNQRNAPCACVNAAAAIIMPPKVVLPLKYSGAATRIGAIPVIQPKPAVTQVRLVRPLVRRFNAVITLPRCCSTRRVRFALRQREAIDVLVDTHERDALVGLARITIRIAADEAAANDVAQE